MKIKYRHTSEPDKIKTYDTKVALKNNPFTRLSQDAFDKMEIEHMEQDMEKGYILSYEIEQ